MCALVRLLISLTALVAYATAGVYLANNEYNLGAAWVNGGANSHIVSVRGGQVYAGWSEKKLYFLKSGMTERSAVAGLPAVNIWDVALVPSGIVWVATAQGLFQYDHIKNSVSNLGVTTKVIYSMAVSPNGTLYLSDSALSLFALSGKSLRPVAGIKARTFAFSANGDIYYTTGDQTVNRRAGLAGKPVVITGLPAKGKVQLVEIDRRDEVVYICNSDGLYFVWPGSDAAIRVERVSGSVAGMGFSPRGDLYFGNADRTFKMTLFATSGEIMTHLIKHERTEISQRDTVLQEVTKLDTVASGLDKQLKDMKMAIVAEIDRRSLEQSSKHLAMISHLDIVANKIELRLQSLMQSMSSSMQSMQQEVSRLPHRN